MAIILALLATTGCGGSEGRLAVDAERIVSLTDAGLTEAAIGAIDSLRSQTENPQSRAELTLLHCRVYEKAGLTVSDAEAIGTALAYAEESGVTAGHGAELRYYLALAYYNNQRYPEAIFEAAEAASDWDGDEAVKGKAYMVLSLCHSAAHNAMSALTFAKMAQELLPDDEAAGRTLADALTAAGRNEEAVEWIGSVAEKMPELSRRQLPALIGMEEYARAVELTDRMEENGMILTEEEELYRAYAKAATGQLAKDDPVLAEPTSDRTYNRDELRVLAEIQRLAGNRNRSEEIGRQLTGLQDSLIARLSESKIYEDLYGLEHSRREAEELNTRRTEVRFWIAAGAGIVLAVLMAGAIILMRLRSEKRRTEQEKQLLVLNEELKQRREEGNRKDDALSEMSGRVDVLFKDHYESIEMAANLLLDASLSKNSEKKIADSLRRVVAECREPKFLRKLEQTINKYRNNAITRMREQIPEINEGEMTIILYSAGNLTPRVMCMLTDLTASALYNKKYRLKKKIAASGAKDAKEFAELF
ncbi:MAG: hypothetical protein K2M04_02845 [Muribaculaceae bacterium]|nr:hypothetical protein [Muribaculaceae bacterium]